MQVILIQPIKGLGNIGDIVSVTSGYARNFLLPKLKAKRATEESIKDFENKKVMIQEDNDNKRAEAEVMSKDIEGLMIVIVRQAGAMGQLYGSVTTKDVSTSMSAKGYTINKNDVHLPYSIKNLGIHKAEIRLHPEVSVNININVAYSVEEAQLQWDKR
jgi:large subunit ribosomal protein L9